ncbi:MAG TPA: peroxiredoxin family protein [Polyangiaceae bacterium]|nr:peroxiredoxin family protein [Polyangiaceae bacterium]
MLRRHVLSLIVATWWCSGSVRAAHAAYARRILRDQHDAETSLADAAGGHSLVVVVMKGHWCPVCRDQLARFASKKQELTSAGAKLVGLNTDAPAANRRMLEDEGIECPVLSDETHELVSELGLWLPREGHPLPAIVVFDRCGDEVARWVGRQPGDRPDSAVFRVLRRLAEERRACSRPSA